MDPGIVARNTEMKSSPKFEFADFQLNKGAMVESSGGQCASMSPVTCMAELCDSRNGDCRHDAAALARMRLKTSSSTGPELLWLTML